MIPILSVTAVGDLMLGDMPINVGIGVGSKFIKYKSYDPFIKIKKELNSDIVFGNLECVVSDFSEKRDIQYRKFKTPKKSIEILAQRGFNILSIANNHVLEHGSKSYIDTIKYLDEFGIDHIGSFKQKYIIKNIKNNKIGFIAASIVEDSFHQGDKYLCKVEELLLLVKRLHQKTEIIFVSIHWGKEHITYPTDEQRLLAKKLIDAGATIIIGHHSHTYQGYEKYNNGIIFYSLGNIVSDMGYDINKYGAMVKIYFSGSKLIDFSIKHTYINNEYIPQFIDYEKLSIDKRKKYRSYLKRELVEGVFKRPLWSTCQNIYYYLLKKIK